MRLNVFNSLIGLCVATAAVSCSDALVSDLDRNPVGGEASDMISFVVADNNTTRGGSFGNRPCGGAVLRSANGADSLYLNAEVSDFDAPSTRGEEISKDNLPLTLNMTCRVRKNATDYVYYFDDTAFTKNGNVWSSKEPYYWLPAGTHYTFFGYYAPDNAEGLTFYGNSDDAVPVPTLDYTVPTNVRDQFDLSYTYVPEYESISVTTDPVALTFGHALSKIMFFASADIIAGTFESITITNVYDKGNLNLGSGDMTLCEDAQLKDFIFDERVSVAGSVQDEQQITGDNNFMLIPGSSTAESKIIVKFRPEGTPDNEPSKTYSAFLKDFKVSDWEKGKGYKYKIGITPDYQITIEEVPEVVDAHYIITKAHIKVDNMPSDKQWELTVSSNDNADVTVTSALNAYQQDGFWIDEIITSSDATSGISARGTNTLTGNDSQDIYIFVPENASPSGKRTISLSVKVDQTQVAADEFEQYHPAWTDDGYGWEQIDDMKIAQFGFYWDKIVYYGYLYACALTGNNTYKKTCQDLIDKNSASEYASVDTYTYRYGELTGWPLTMRYCIKINYGLLNNKINTIDDNGLSNTINLYNLAGTSATNEFENVVATTLKTESGHTTEPAFRLGDGGTYKDDDGNTCHNAPAPSGGTESPDSPAVGECLKKNRYFLLKTVSSEGDVSYSPIIKENDIKWYLPAVKQFDNFPTSVSVADGGFNSEKSLYWSSTAIANTQNARLGNNSASKRLDKHKIRACRNRD